MCILASFFTVICDINVLTNFNEIVLNISLCMKKTMSITTVFSLVFNVYELNLWLCILHAEYTYADQA